MHRVRCLLLFSCLLLFLVFDAMASVHLATRPAPGQRRVWAFPGAGCGHGVHSIPLNGVTVTIFSHWPTVVIFAHLAIFALLPGVLPPVAVPRPCRWLPGNAPGHAGPRRAVARRRSRAGPSAWRPARPGGRGSTRS